MDFVGIKRYLASLLPVLSGRDSGNFFKDAGKVALVIESDKAGNLNQGAGGRTQQRFGMINPYSVYIEPVPTE